MPTICHVAAGYARSTSCYLFLLSFGSLERENEGEETRCKMARDKIWEREVRLSFGSFLFSLLCEAIAGRIRERGAGFLSAFSPGLAVVSSCFFFIIGRVVLKLSCMLLLGFVRSLRFLPDCFRKGRREEKSEGRGRRSCLRGDGFRVSCQEASCLHWECIFMGWGFSFLFYI